MASRMLGFKLGIILTLLGFLLISQFHLKGIFGIPVIEDYVNFTFPTTIGSVPLIPIFWAMFLFGIFALITAILDKPPFNY